MPAASLCSPEGACPWRSTHGHRLTSGTAKHCLGLCDTLVSWTKMFRSPSSGKIHRTGRGDIPSRGLFKRHILHCSRTAVSASWTSPSGARIWRSMAAASPECSLDAPGWPGCSGAAGRWPCWSPRAKWQVLRRRALRASGPCRAAHSCRRDSRAPSAALRRTHHGDLMMSSAPAAQVTQGKLGPAGLHTPTGGTCRTPGAGEFHLDSCWYRPCLAVDAAGRQLCKAASAWLLSMA